MKIFLVSVRNNQYTWEDEVGNLELESNREDIKAFFKKNEAEEFAEEQQSLESGSDPRYYFISECDLELPPGAEIKYDQI